MKRRLVISLALIVAVLVLRVGLEVLLAGDLGRFVGEFSWR